MDRSIKSRMWVAAWMVSRCCVVPGLGEMWFANSRLSVITWSELCASKEMTKFSGAITRTRNCIIPNSVRGRTSNSLLSRANPSCEPHGPAPPSLSHLESAPLGCGKEPLFSRLISSIVNPMRCKRRACAQSSERDTLIMVPSWMSLVPRQDQVLRS